MFKLSLTMILFSQAAFSGTFSSLNLGKIVNPEGRAEYDVIKYNPSAMNWGKEINIVKRSHSYNSCGPASISVSRLEAISSLSRFYQEDDLSDTLSDLVKKKKIVKAIYGSDGNEGESEYCSTATMKFYSVDGEVLVLSFDFNT